MEDDWSIVTQFSFMRRGAAAKGVSRQGENVSRLHRVGSLETFRGGKPLGRILLLYAEFNTLLTRKMTRDLNGILLKRPSWGRVLPCSFKKKR